jgi:hypothetical protein
MLISERHAVLLAAISKLFAADFRAADLLSACAGLAIKEPDHAELDAAINALCRKPNVTKLAKLLTRIHSKPCGAYRLDREFDTHLKGWRYVIRFVDSPSQEELARHARDAAKLELQDLTEAPVLTHAVLEQAMAKPDRAEAVISKAERERAKEIAAAERAVASTAVAADPELSAQLKDIRLAEVQARLRRRAERERAAADELPEFLKIEESEFAAQSGKYDAVYEPGMGTTQVFKGWRKKRVSAATAATNPHMTPDQERELANRPPGHREERARWVADPNDPGKLIKERYLQHVPYSGLAAAAALCSETVRMAGGSGVPGFIDTRQRVQHDWHPYGSWHPFAADEAQHNTGPFVSSIVIRDAVTGRPK